MNRKALVGVTLAMALALPLAGCGGKMKISAERMCSSAGGKYSVATQTCDAPAQNARKAADYCQAHNGVYDNVLQVCEFEGTK